MVFKDGQPWTRSVSFTGRSEHSKQEPCKLSRSKKRTLSTALTKVMLQHLPTIIRQRYSGRAKPSKHMPYQQSSDSCTVANRTVQTHAIPTVIRQVYSGKPNSPNTCHTNSHQTGVQWQAKQSKHMPYQQSSDSCTVASQTFLTHAVIYQHSSDKSYSGRSNIPNILMSRVPHNLFSLLETVRKWQNNQPLDHMATKPFSSKKKKIILFLTLSLLFKCRFVT